MIVNTRISGKPRVLVIDLTKNSKNFEYQMSSDLLNALKAKGVDVASPDVLQPQNDEEYEAIFRSSKLDFNILMLVTHGGADRGGDDASAVAIPGGRSTWYQLALLTGELRDKLVCLSVCHGFCKDVLEAFVRDGHFAMAVVGSEEKLNRSEVLAFYPEFFSDLASSSPGYIEPNEVRLFTEERNTLANGKMKAFSEAFTS